MKRQIDFDVRVLTLNAGGINGAYTHTAMVQWVHENYPTDLGWEVANVENIQLSADGVSVMLFLARYEYVYESPAVLSEPFTGEVVQEKRKRGRPPKESAAPEGVAVVE